MDIIKAIMLGVVEGITEYLPVSSTGHLIIFGEWINFDEHFAKVFDIFIQSGAILAALVIYRKEMLGFNGGANPVRKLFSASLEKKFVFKSLPRELSSGARKVFDNWKKLFVAFFPAAAVGLAIGDFIEEKFFNSVVVAVALVVGGLAIIFIDREPAGEKAETEDSSKISYFQALVVGFAQCFALVPGVSRSAATIIGGMIGGLTRKNSAKFSFMLAVPTLGAAGAYSLFKNRELVLGSVGGAFLLAVGFIVSFLVAYAVIRWFILYLQKNNFQAFGWYRILLGSTILMLYFLR